MTFQIYIKQKYWLVTETIRYHFAEIIFICKWPFLKRKGKILNINQFEQKIYSQHGEDGIIKFFLDSIGRTNKFCVEFGVGDGRECNTRYLIVKEKWISLHMDYNNGGNSKIKKELITAENINYLFRKYNVPLEFDLLSIDIDFNDYWVWKEIVDYRPRLVIIEYNASVPVSESRVVTYSPDRCWDGSNYFGASLLALQRLGAVKGYTLVACDNSGTNAFFIRSDILVPNLIIKDISVIYKPPGYGEKINGRHIGHRSSHEIMNSI